MVVVLVVLQGGIDSTNTVPCTETNKHKLKLASKLFLLFFRDVSVAVASTLWGPKHANIAAV